MRGGVVSGALTQKAWLTIPSPQATAPIRLFAFPYGGGGPSIFAQWPRWLPREIEVCAVQMPGRDARLGEAPLTRWSEAIPQLVAALTPWMDRPYALFGHSLGAVLAFEVAHALPASARSRLLHLFVSGRRAPHLPADETLALDLPDHVIVEELKRLAGTPGEILESAEMMEVYLPLLRADFTLSETYAYQARGPLRVPLSAYGGATDAEVPSADVAAWRHHTAAAFRQRTFAGGHFFLNDQRSALVAHLAFELSETITRTGVLTSR